MKVLGFTEQHSGCGYHRVLLPVAFMNDIKGYVTNMFTEEKFNEDWDLILYNRMSQYDQHWGEIKKDAKIVLDLDDYWKLPQNHILFNQYEKLAAQIERNIINADLVTVTNEILAAKVRPLNPNVLIFPNALPYGQNQFHEERREDERCRIFWAGGQTHEQDLKMLRGPIRKLKVHKDKIKMVMGGYSDSTWFVKRIWDRMFSYFTDGGTLPYMKLHGTLPNCYMQMYENADLMLIPLEASEWHACKSNLKILEAAAKKIPCIVSNVAPYNLDSDAPVLWVNKASDWFEHMNYLINKPDERKRLGQELYDWATTKYNLSDVNRARREAFESLCGTRARLQVLPSDGGTGELLALDPIRVA